MLALRGSIQSQLQSQSSGVHMMHVPSRLPILGSWQGNLLEGINHLEALLIILRQHRVARSVDHQRLHSCGDSSLNLFDVVTEEQNRLWRHLYHRKLAQAHLQSPQRNEKLTFNSPDIFS